MWIRGCDVMPEAGLSVLVCNTGSVQQVASLEAFNGKVMWESTVEEFDQTFTYPISHFTHWAPIPTPPREDEGNIIIVGM